MIRQTSRQGRYSTYEYDCPAGKVQVQMRRNNGHPATPVDAIINGRWV